MGLNSSVTEAEFSLWARDGVVTNNVNIKKTKKETWNDFNEFPVDLFQKEDTKHPGHRKPSKGQAGIGAVVNRGSKGKDLWGFREKTGIYRS